ncbi:hypothetical protein [Undibacterium sp.]|uniref:hypothetical protein n=1 Tax=Undibacterium sp. TaxID=1914977 RepID=UPI003520A5FD
MPVSFKWFAPSLFDGNLGVSCEESAGASFVHMNGSAWTTDKDGIVAALMTGQMKVKTGRAAGTEKSPLQPVPARDHQQIAGERQHHGHPHHRTRQHEPHRRRESHHQQRLVRSPPVRHRGNLQDLCREF